MEEGKGRQSILPSFFNEKELEVCDILVDLENISKQSTVDDLLSGIFNWTITKKRCKGGRTCISPSSVLPSEHPAIANAVMKVEVDEVEASSPATLVQHRQKPPKDFSNKRGKEESMGMMIQELTQSGKILRREVDRVRSYRNELHAHNLNLKAWKQKMLLKKDEKIKNMSLTKNGFSFGQQFGISNPQQQYLQLDQYHHHHHHQLFPCSASAQSSSSSSSSLRQPIGPRGIPGLDVSVEEAFGLDTLQLLDNNTGMITRGSKREIKDKIKDLEEE